MAGRTGQRGISFITVLFIVAVLAAAGLMAAKVAPSFLEYQAALKAINKARDGGSVQEVRNIFDRAAEVDNISSISGKDLEISKNGDQTQVSFSYEREFHMFGPAWLVMKYSGTSRPGR